MSIEEKLWKAFNKALGQYQLIDENDHILIGLSGGKDSLLLLQFLARRSRILVPRFKVSALHVRMDNIQYETDTTYLQRFCAEQGVPLHIVTTSFPTKSPDGGTSTAQRPAPSTHQKPPCFLCSWQRRKQLFNVAQEIGCTKIALGHHQDDIIHTALMNLTFQGHFATMPARLRLRKMPLTIIRPLCLCQEDDIRLYAEQQHYEQQLKRCPYEHDTNRTTARELFAHMERMNPEARYTLFRALEADHKLVED
jgi:tRNA(Ile)-lysidine synthase TilS/MesJ